MAGNRGTRRVQGRMYAYDDENGRWVRLSVDEDGNLTSDTQVTVSGRTVQQVSSMESNNTLGEILTVLKKIEYHLSIATDTNLNDQDV
jgi:hypothetical protein